MTEAQKLRVLELAVQAEARPEKVVEVAREFERYLATDSAVVPSEGSAAGSLASSRYSPTPN
jgi:hypothetical protein